MKAEAEPIAIVVQERSLHEIAVDAMADAIEAAEDAVWERQREHVARLRSLGRLQAMSAAELWDDFCNGFGQDP